MAIIAIDKFTLDGKSLSKVFSSLMGFFIKQPKWLKKLVAYSFIIGALYYGYNYFNKNQDIRILQEEVCIINERFGSLSEEQFQENLIYLISEIKLLQQEETQSYNDQMLELELLVNFIQRHHPNDPIIHDFEAMRSRRQTNHEIYIQNYQRIIENLMKTVDNEKQDL